MAAPIMAVQQAIKTALDAVITDRPIYGHPLADGFVPYVRLGETDMRDEVAGFDFDFTIHNFSNTHGKFDVEETAFKIRQALHEQVLAVTGYNFCFLRLDFQNTFIDADVETWHCVQRFHGFIS